MSCCKGSAMFTNFLFIHKAPTNSWSLVSHTVSVRLYVCSNKNARTLRSFQQRNMGPAWWITKNSRDLFHFWPEWVKVRLRKKIFFFSNFFPPSPCNIHVHKEVEGDHPPRKFIKSWIFYLVTTTRRPGFFLFFLPPLLARKQCTRMPCNVHINGTLIVSIPGNDRQTNEWLNLKETTKKWFHCRYLVNFVTHQASCIVVAYFSWRYNLFLSLVTDGRMDGRKDTMSENNDHLSAAAWWVNRQKKPKKILIAVILRKYTSAKYNREVEKYLISLHYKTTCDLIWVDFNPSDPDQMGGH